MSDSVTDTPPRRHRELTEAELDKLCLVPATANNGWMTVSNRLCSLDRDHEGQHIAYRNHVVTGNGADVIWLGPWEDDRPYEGPLTDRLREEWYRRP